jgi:WD40 repeat protein
VSPSGEVAIGRAGYIELRAENQSARRYRCADACGPVLALTFSPDGSLLAYQGTRGLQERRKGLGYAVVLDAHTGLVVARLESVAARALVAFSADGRQLSTANTTQIDATEMSGLRSWDTSDWTLTRHLTGTERQWRAIGHLGRSEFAAAYEADGRLELRDLSNDALIWSEPLIGPPVEDAEPAAADTAGLSLIEFAPNGRFLVSYESGSRRQVGTIVIRHAGDGSVAAMYDVPGVTGLAIAPDSRTFAYGTRDAQTYMTLAYVPF